MADRHGSLKMNIVDLVAILRNSLKTMPDTLPVEVVLENSHIVEIDRVEVHKGSLCLFVRSDDNG